MSALDGKQTREMSAGTMPLKDVGAVILRNQTPQMRHRFASPLAAMKRLVARPTQSDFAPELITGRPLRQQMMPRQLVFAAAHQACHQPHSTPSYGTVRMINSGSQSSCSGSRDSIIRGSLSRLPAILVERRENSRHPYARSVVSRLLTLAEVGAVH